MKKCKPSSTKKLGEKTGIADKVVFRSQIIRVFYCYLLNVRPYISLLKSPDDLSTVFIRRRHNVHTSCKKCEHYLGTFVDGNKGL